MGILFVSFVLWLHRLYKNNNAMIINFNSNESGSTDVLSGLLATRLPNCGPCDSTTVRISAVPRSQVMAALSYFAFSSIVDTFSWISSTSSSKQLAGDLTLAVSPQYIWAITSQCACKGFINENESKLERVIDSYASISSSFTFKTTLEYDFGTMLRNNLANTMSMLIGIEYPREKWYDALMLLLLLVCGGIVPSIFTVSVCSMLRRSYIARSKIYQMVSSDLSTCLSVEASTLFNGSCPICWTEWIDVTANKKSIIALQCNHGLCRECLTTMELTKLSDLSALSGLEGGSGGGGGGAAAGVGAAALAVSASWEDSDGTCSIRCPCCCRHTSYTQLRRVTLTQQSCE